MTHREGYKTLEQIMQELGTGQPKIRQAIKALSIQPVTFNRDRRVKYYTEEDVTHIAEWLDIHDRTPATRSETA